MPSLSHHISALKPSATLEINSAAQNLRDQGHKIWNFSVGEPDYPPPVCAYWQTVQSMCSDPIRYGKAGGGVKLREAIQGKLTRENNLTVQLDEIVCGVGAKQILHHLMHAILNEGDEVLIHKPYWTSYSQQIASAKAVTVAIPYHRDDGGSPFDPDYLERYIGPRTKAFLLCSPNNPAGYMVHGHELKRLAEYLNTKDIWIISDEIYEYITFDHPHQSVYNHCPQLKDRYIHINGISKSFAMTGWRMGYMAAPQAITQLVKTLISHSSTSLPIFVERAACSVIEQGADLMSTEIAQLKDKMKLSVELLSQVNHISWIHPQGAFYLFVDLRQLLKLSDTYHHNNTLALSMDLLKGHHITVVAGEAFGCPGFIRISFATSNHDLKGGLSKLVDFLNSLTSSDSS